MPESVKVLTVYECPKHGLIESWSETFPVSGGGRACHKCYLADRDAPLVEVEAVPVIPQAELDRLRAVGTTQLTEAMMLIETAEEDGYVSEGWREDARSWLRPYREAVPE